MDNQQTRQTLKFRLKKSKADQFGRDMDVFVGSTRDGLCPGTSTVALYDSKRPRTWLILQIQ